VYGELNVSRNKQLSKAPYQNSLLIVGLKGYRIVILLSIGYPLLSENMVATKMAPEFFPLLF
jgi:hypothetical protein